MRRASGIALLAGAGLLAGCSAGATGMSPEGQCPSSVDLRVSPYRILRGDPIEITVTWETNSPLEAATAKLYIGIQDEVEVEVPLVEQAEGTDYIYAGTQLNPFGLGSPVGSGWVLAEATAVGDCGGPATGTTAFELR